MGETQESNGPKIPQEQAALPPTERSIPESPPHADAAPDPDATLTHRDGQRAVPLVPGTGTVPGRWGALRLIEKVGEGGFGETFRARDERLERDVALKLLREDASRNVLVTGRVIREGAMLARVRHPNVVIVHGAELIDGRVGLWMEYVRGRTLETLVKSGGPLEVREAIAIGIDLCRALAAVHAAGIIHGDIKTGNVMREDGGRTVLMDFGAGLDLERAEVPGGGSIAGTPLYMAPEQFRWDAPTAASDIYSVGVLLYRLVTGAYPMTPPRGWEMHRGHEGWLRRSLAEARAGLPGRFVQVVERCLSHEPRDRYSSAKALEAALVSAVADLTAYREARVAEWSQARYRLDREFVALTVQVDRGEETASGRWDARPERYQGLPELLAAVEDPVVVLLGPPGSGKSTLLRRLELDVAVRALAGSDERDTVTFLIQLNRYGPERSGGALPAPGGWLSERWQARYPDLPPLRSLSAEGRVLLLLDGLNEMSVRSAAMSREAVILWKEFLQGFVLEHRGNRAVFTCRTLDYSAPLSTASLRVPHVTIEPMADDQVEQFLVRHSPEQGARIWSHLRGTPQLEVMRSPYFLTLLADQVEATGGLPEGRAGLLTGFVRQALRREVERDNPLFGPEGLLDDRDVRRIAHGRWGSPWELPERGPLIPKLADLGFGMQARSEGGSSSQVRISYDEALELLDHGLDEDIVRAGEALLVLDEDPTHDEVKFFHQLLQEYFAGRRLASNPELSRTRSPWRAQDMSPSLAELLQSLPAGESLPPLGTTGWEEAVLLAGAMSPDPNEFVRGVVEFNLALAGRCASQPEVRPRISDALLAEVRQALVERGRDQRADLRSRIDAALVLGPLGDPRFESRKGPQGAFLMPPMVEIEGGPYPIGEDDAFEWFEDRWADHTPRHHVSLLPFRLGRFPVTNAEWARFMESGGYEDERWWDTRAALQWQQGVGTAESLHANVRHWLEVFRREPGQVERRWTTGNFTAEVCERWMKRLAMTEEEFEAHLLELYPGGRIREPEHWHDPNWSNPSQPVVGVCWFEARAYANWLSAQSGEPFRLPSEVEWEAAARGREGRPYSYGGFDPTRGNSAATRIRRTTPVGVFVEGDTPEGVSDLTGNIEEWTASLYGAVGVDEEASFRYPYRADDGREDPSAAADVRRVLRGGAWSRDHVLARAANRVGSRPASRDSNMGLRLAMGGR